MVRSPEMKHNIKNGELDRNSLLKAEKKITRGHNARKMETSICIKNYMKSCTHTSCEPRSRKLIN